MVQPGRPQMAAQYDAEEMRFACKETNEIHHKLKIQYLVLTAGRNLV